MRDGLDWIYEDLFEVTFAAADQVKPFEGLPVTDVKEFNMLPNEKKPDWLSKIAGGLDNKGKLMKMGPFDKVEFFKEGYALVLKDGMVNGVL